MSTRSRHASTAATVSGGIAILLWSSLALMAVITTVLPPFEVLAISFAIGGTCAMLLGGSGAGIVAGWRQPLPALLLAVFALFGYHALYFIAFRLAPPVEVNLINYLWPLLIVVFAAMTPGIRLHLRQVLGTLLGLVGVVVMISRGHGFSMTEANLPGYLAAFGAALVWSSYSVINRRFHAVPSSAIGAACLIVAALASIVHGVFETTVAPSPAQWLTLLLMGLGPVGIAFRLWDRGTKHGDIALLGTLSYAAPVLSTLLLLCSGNVDAHWSQALAVILLLIGAVLSASASNRANPSAPESAD
ncbi:MAG: EamA family transporter [Dokdonella sp.]|uniref:aromatic amino acid exporter YddG n=1 Tax=Dokdonella sp. TaxID=2291710 RepID=UPI003BAE7DEC